MSRKEQPGTSKPSPMASLSRIVSRLDQARLTGEKLEIALGHLGIAVGAGAVAIYRKWYDDMEYRKEADVVHSLIFTPAVTGGGVFLTGSTKKNARYQRVCLRLVSHCPRHYARAGDRKQVPQFRVHAQDHH